MCLVVCLWVHLTTVSVQCLRRLWVLFIIIINIIIIILGGFCEQKSKILSTAFKLHTTTTATTTTTTTTFSTCLSGLFLQSDYSMLCWDPIGHTKRNLQGLLVWHFLRAGCLHVAKLTVAMHWGWILNYVVHMYNSSHYKDSNFWHTTTH